MLAQSNRDELQRTVGDIQFLTKLIAARAIKTADTILAIASTVGVTVGVVGFTISDKSLMSIVGGYVLLVFGMLGLIAQFDDLAGRRRELAEYREMRDQKLDEAKKLVAEGDRIRAELAKKGGA